MSKLSDLQKENDRLRECLSALSKVTGHSIYRVEIEVHDKGSRLIITGKTEQSERDCAVLIAGFLKLTHDIKEVTLPAEAVDG